MHFADLPDDALVGLLAQGDVRALEALYERHGRALYSLAVKMLADPDLAEEIVQESFLKLWQRPGTFDPTRGRLITWLLGVTHHRAVDLLRRQRLERQRLQEAARDGTGEPLVERSEDPEERAWSTLRQEAVAGALAALPPNQREPLELAYFQGLTQAEIAARLGEPLGTIKTRMRLALRKLRSALRAAEARPGVE